MSAATGRRRRLVVAITRAAVILVTVALVVALGAALYHSQQQSERQLAERFEGRGQVAASFAATWVAQLLDQEVRVAVDSLSGPTADIEERLASAVDVLEMPNAVLLDAHGHALAVHPSTPELIGQNLATRYADLRRAVNGRPAVASTITTAPGGAPIVGFAVPYDTPTGRRVFGGAYELNDTPLGAFMKSVTTIPEAQVYLVDDRGTIIATNHVGSSSVGTRHQVPDAVAAMDTPTARRDYSDSSGRRHFFASRPVAGTPWSLVLTSPHDTLFAPIRGPERILPWLALGVVALLAGAASAMFLRLLTGRDQLRALNAALTSSARTDPLTDLPNRRHLDESLTAALSAGQRHQLPVSVLVIDLDHFKHVNDTHGHTTGDRVLEHAAGILRGAVRDEDLIGRWGGEEFLAVLLNTDRPGAAHIAERVRSALEESPYVTDAGESIVVKLSVGSATSLSGGNKDELIHRADQALYQAKSDGRNRTRSALSQPTTQLHIATGVGRNAG